MRNLYPQKFEQYSEYLDALQSSGCMLDKDILDELNLIVNSVERIMDLTDEKIILKVMYPLQFIATLSGLFGDKNIVTDTASIKNNRNITIICTDQCARRDFKINEFTYLLKDSGLKLIYLSDQRQERFGRSKKPYGYVNLLDLVEWKSLLRSKHHLGHHVETNGAIKIEIL